MQGVEFSELTTVSPLDRLLEVSHAAPLRASLKDAFVPMHRIREFLAGTDSDTAGLLAIDIFACFRC